MFYAKYVARQEKKEHLRRMVIMVFWDVTPCIQTGLGICCPSGSRFLRNVGITSRDIAPNIPVILIHTVPSETQI